MSARASIAVLAFGLALSQPAIASDVGYIYGRVETVDGPTYEGELRWGTEEAFWGDIFNATKIENENLGEVNGRQLERIRSHRWIGGDFFGLVNPDLTHVLAVRFGDLKRIRTRGGDHLIAEFRNGEEMSLGGGSNDVGAEITVIDTKRGRQDIHWDRIRSIEFKDTPAHLENKLGEPIYGAVKAGRYTFTGRIQWDNDETLSSDTLDGYTANGKESIAFADITEIRKQGTGSLVTLRSGRRVFMNRTNDVNHENRGIVVIVPNVGSVKVGWNDFDQVTLGHAPDSGPSYADYAKAADLSGRVVTRNGHHDGRIVFDLDESWDFELLQGMNRNTEYLIPFRDIARIKRESFRQSLVQLRNGTTIELEDSQDVSRKNDGLLVYAGSSKPQYIEWRNVTEIEFR